jgi:hypothetical protein
MDLKQLQDDLFTLRRIERLLKLSIITENDVMRLLRLASRGIPRAEYLYGIYAFYYLKNAELTNQWFNKCKRHANGYYLLKLAMFYRTMGNQ